MLCVLPGTFKLASHATNQVAASCANTDFRLEKNYVGVTPYNRVTSLASKQVCLGQVKRQRVQILLQKVQLCLRSETTFRNLQQSDLLQDRFERG